MTDTYTEITSLDGLSVGDTIYVGDDKTAVTLSAAPGGKKRYVLDGVSVVIRNLYQTVDNADGSQTKTVIGVSVDDLYILDSDSDS